MSEEMTATMDETAVSEGASVESGAEGGVSDSQIQDLMASAWFDDGLNSVVDGDGTQLLNRATGQPYKSIEEFRAAVGAKTTQQAKAQPQQAQQAKPAPAQPKATPQAAAPTQPQQGQAPAVSPFLRDGQLDYGSVKDAAVKMAAVSYQSQLFPKVPVMPPAPAAPAAPAAPENPFAPVDNLRQSLTANLLTPLEKLAQEGHIEQGSPAWNALNAQYIAYQKQIDETCRNREREISAKLAEEKAGDVKSSLENERARYAAENNIKTVSTEFFGNSGDKLFWELIVGKTDPSTGNIVERGPAADLLDMMFDAVHHGKEFKTADEFKTGYQNWFAKFASNQNNIRALCKTAFALWTHGNLDLIKTGAKQAGEKSAAKRQALKQPAPSGGMPQAAGPAASPVMQLWGMGGNSNQ